MRHEELRVAGGFAIGVMFGNEAALPDDPKELANLAAVGLAVVVWRNSPIEDCHGRIRDGQMMRANAAVSRLIRKRLDDLDASSVDAWSSGLSLVLCEFQLPDGRPVASVLRRKVGPFRRHVDHELGRFALFVNASGRDVAVRFAALSGSTQHWWLTPAWPAIVHGFTNKLWDESAPNRIVDIAGDPPGRCADPDKLAHVLLDGPDRLSDDEAEWCIRAGVGFVHVAPGDG